MKGRSDLRSHLSQHISKTARQVLHNLIALIPESTKFLLGNSFSKLGTLKTGSFTKASILTLKIPTHCQAANKKTALHHILTKSQRGGTARRPCNRFSCCSRPPPNQLLQNLGKCSDPVIRINVKGYKSVEPAGYTMHYALSLKLNYGKYGKGIRKLHCFFPLQNLNCQD